MEINLIIEELRDRINEFRLSSELFKTNSIYQYNYNAITIAISLTEIGINEERPIKDNEMVWFKGHRYIEDTFGANDDWKDIYKLYYDLVQFVKEKNYFN